MFKRIENFSTMHASIKYTSITIHIPVNILAFTYDVQRVMPALNPTPKHPRRIHAAQKTAGTASSFRPKRLQKAVTDDGHQQLVAFADDNPRT